MKFTLSWLKTYLQTDASLEVIAQKLTMIGLEVENIDNPAERLAGFRTARVREAVQHPNADRLRLCRVETADGEMQVVCGAPNARTGLVGIFAPVGSYVPGIDVTLTEAEIRGVASRGMLCSEHELELSDEHDGIIDLPEDTPIGLDAAEALGLDDPVFEISVTPNRGDCFGVRGIARDLAAAGIGTFIDAERPLVKAGFPCPVKIGLEFPDARDAQCRAFSARYIRGVKNGESPDWLKKRLLSVGLRPINCLVDITNFFTVDQARPLHVYDADKIAGGRIMARLGREGEEFAALDGKTYEATPADCVIADEQGVLGFGGIIGGEGSGSSETTQNVLLESAWFEPLAVAQTGRRHGIVSDARMRFERTVDPASTLSGLDQASELILELCGGEVSELELAGDIPDFDQVIQFPVSELKRLSGLTLDFVEVRHYLRALGFNVTGSGESVMISAPSWRPDIDGKADIVEEIVRMVGLEQLPAAPLPELEVNQGGQMSARQNRVRSARRELAARGLAEAVTWSFISTEEALRFGGGQAELVVSNPIASDKAVMRPNLLPGLLASMARNQRQGFQDLALFEVGQVFLGNRPEDQHVFACGLRQGLARSPAPGRDWREGAKKVDLFDAKADLSALLQRIGGLGSDLPLSRDAPDFFHPGRSGTVRLGPKVLGHFGEAHPQLLDTYDLTGPVVMFMLDIDALPEGRSKGVSRPALARQSLMPVRRDFAFLMDQRDEVATLVRAVRKADKKRISDVKVFDIFADDKLGEGKKSVAVEVTLTPDDKTFTDADLEKLSADVVEEVSKATGATLR